MSMRASILPKQKMYFRAIRPSIIRKFRCYSALSFPPHTLINMPALSPTMTQGNLGEWHKAIGDEISPGDVLVEIETDKAQMDLECQEEGFLAKIFLQADEKDVLVNTPLCVLAENKEDVGKFADFTVESLTGSAVASQTTQAPVAVAATTPTTPQINDKAQQAVPSEINLPTTGRIFVSPLAKSLAFEGGINLSSIAGTGPDGRIIKNDVLNYKPVRIEVSAPSESIAHIAPIVPMKTVVIPPASSDNANYVDLPLSKIRKVIASRLTESKATIPHYYMTQELDMGRVMKLREVLNKDSNGKFKLSINDFVVKASSLALIDIPQVNSSWNGEFIREYKSADIAIAVATDNGLITPIVRDAQTKGLSMISNSVKILAEKGRSGKLAPHEYQGGTFTISNLGMYGIQNFTAIINPPHSAILAVGGIEDKLVVDDTPKGFKAIKVMKVTLSPDHRVIDGAVAAQWLQKFKSYIENPLTMLL